MFMKNKIVFKKLGFIYFEKYVLENFKNDNHKRKNIRLCNRLLQNKKRLNDYSCRSPVNRNCFRTNWYCEDCYLIFKLKLLKRFKTLKNFPLQCNDCHSLQISRKNDITFVLKRNSNYYLSII